MGSGRWDTTLYNESASVRKSSGVKDFAYTETAHQVHDNLKPERIIGKPFGKLEARDSDEHPNSMPIIFTFDVTGSNRSNAIVAQQRLPELMEALTQQVADPQIAIWANDDFNSVRNSCVQLSDFESDNRIDDHIRNTWLTGAGGGNMGESYDLLLFAAARLTVHDAMEKRGKKGYLFLYADEPIFPAVSKEQVKAVFGVDIEADISIEQIIQECQQLYEVYLLYPENAYPAAQHQYPLLFGADHVIRSQSPETLCQQVASIVAQHEAELTAPAPAVPEVTAVAEGTTSDWKGGKAVGADRL